MYHRLIGIALAIAAGFATLLFTPSVLSAEVVQVLPVQACVVEHPGVLTATDRALIAQCLGWQDEGSFPVCRGFYHPLQVTPLSQPDEIRIKADEVLIQPEGRSQLQGHVEVQETARIVSADTAYIYRDGNTNKVKKIELVGGVHYLEPGRLMIAKEAVIHPEDRSGHASDVLYRFNTQRKGAMLPSWGQARWVERFANQDYLLRNVTYSTCAPKDKAWQIEAKEITLDHAKAKGVAKNAVLKVGDWPVFYTPYLSFPTSNERKSGFLLPMPGYSNVGGFDLALPYYWNIAPNYDATIIPHEYSLRGFMLGGNFRFLTPHSSGTVGGNFLPHDRAFSQFITEHEGQYPSLIGNSSNRWSFFAQENTAFTDNLRMHVNYQQVSDDYYLQDFSSNLAVLTQNQLLRQGDVTYTTDHWLFSGVVQSYQTLHPIDQTVIANIYERLPQLLAQGSYSDLPFNANFNLASEFDYFRWPTDKLMQPQGPRYHLNPVLSLPQVKPWGYVTPEIQLQENYYEVNYTGENFNNSFNRTIPRYSLDSGLTFERSSAWMGRGYTQLLEPRIYYLNVPYHDQTNIPVYESAYMIFTADQLFRDNRFSGFDRIGDANQLAYALSSRWLSEDTGQEKVSVTVGQIRYFADRRVQLCYRQQGACVDNPLFLGYTSPTAKSSPIASRAVYHLNNAWIASGDYVWDPYTHATNNGNLNFHYQPVENHILNLGYSYLVSGNVLGEVNTPIQNNPLHQASIAAAWPVTERWSTIGAYGYNISEGYSMLTFLGLQYDSCCWAVRLMGGRTFQSLSVGALTPQYNNNVYLQVQLKGLGSLASGDPLSVIHSYLPSYRDTM